MPNFSDGLQNNSILTRRMMKLKMDKGFTINQEEVDTNMNQGMKQYDTHVSSALSQNQPSALSGLLGIDNIDLIGANEKPMKQVEKKKESP